MTESQTGYSAKDLNDFLTYLGEKGLMAKQTVVARRAACNKMLGILDAGERNDIRQLDIDSVAQRFSNLEGQGYTPDSLKTYKSRVAKAIEDFIRYKRNPAGFKVNTPKTKQSGKDSASSPQSGATAKTPPVTPSGPDSVLTPSTASTLSVPIPIRLDAAIVVTGVPYDLKKSEATKVANVIMALAGEHE